MKPFTPLILLLFSLPVFAQEKEENDICNVLDFVIGVYTDHGYHESGNWGGTPRYPKRRSYSYKPYSGELPEYEYSDFRLPVLGKLTSGFGYRPRFSRYHHGIDISLQSGDTVRSVLPGVVVKVGYEPRGYGRYVIVAHAGNLETLYAHLGPSLVFIGQQLQTGDPLGLGGTSGNATGPHLHFETRYNGVAIDPVSWFNLRL